MLSECVEWPGYRTKTGYGQQKLDGKVQYVHRLAYATANGLSLQALDGQVVRHKCDNRACVNPAHLEIGSQADNIRDMQARGRKPKGETSTSAKLSDAMVAEARSRYRFRDKQNSFAAMADEMGVSRSTLRQAVKGESWRHIK